MVRNWLVSRRQKVIVALVGAIIILAGSSIILTPNTPPVSRARMMVLEAADIMDGKWHQQTVGDNLGEIVQNVTSAAYSDFQNYSNGSTLTVNINLVIYNNETNCRSDYLSLHLNGHLIGDEGAYTAQLSDYNQIIFRKANVMVVINLMTLSNWTGLNETALKLAGLQLQKIESNL